jgi:hypothetical protein
LFKPFFHTQKPLIRHSDRGLRTQRESLGGIFIHSGREQTWFLSKLYNDSSLPRYARPLGMTSRLNLVCVMFDLGENRHTTLLHFSKGLKLWF